MIPAAFDFVRAGSSEEAVSLLTQHGDEAKLLMTQQTAERTSQ